MDTAFLFVFSELALELILKYLGVKKVFKVDRSELQYMVDWKPRGDEIIIICYEENGLTILEDIRFKYNKNVPIIVLSFSSRAVVESKLSRWSFTGQSKLRFGKGTYFLQIPFKIKELKALLDEARPIDKADFIDLIKDFNLKQSQEVDADFRHSCANMASAIRILQGAYYIGEISRVDYYVAVKSLWEISSKIPTMSSYTQIIGRYLDILISELESDLQEEEIPVQDVRKKILLIDDEAVSAGWYVVLTTIFKKHGYSIHFLTERGEMDEYMDTGKIDDFDIILLDLMMPDKPEYSISFIKLMSEQFPYIPVIVFSALNDIRYFKQCKQAGAFDYFVKELGPDDRDPIAYFKRLKWLLARSEDLSDEKRKQEIREEFDDKIIIYSREVELCIPINSDGQMFLHREWHSFFAYLIDSVAPGSQKDLSEIEDKRTRLLSWFLREPADGRHITLRYITDPEQESLTISIIGKTSGTTLDESKEKAYSMYINLSYILNSFPLYRIRSVNSMETLFKLLEPFNAGDIKMISREEITGFLGKQEFTATYPFLFNKTTSLNDLFEILIQHREPICIDISLSPLSLDDDLKWFRNELNNAILQFELNNPKGQASMESYQEGIEIKRNIPLPRPFKPGIEEQEIALYLLKNQVESLSDGGLLSEFRIASPSTIPSMIIESIRYDFFGHQAKMKITTFSEDSLKEERENMRFLLLKKPGRDKNFLKNIMDISQAKSIFQLPIPGNEGISGLKTEQINIIDIPPNIVKTISNKNGFLIAEGYSKGKGIPVYIKPEDLMKHLYICGRSGSGKTTLIERLAVSIVEKGKGICFIDPHGDSAERLLHFLPNRRKQDVIYFNPDDPECPERLNLLENDGTTANQEAILNELLAIFYRLYQKDWIGPVFERTLRFTLLLGMAARKTMSELSKIWNDKTFRDECLAKVDGSSDMGKELINFWDKEFPNMTSGKGEWASGFRTWFLSKFDRLLINESMRRALSATKTTINFELAINNDKIIIIRIPKGSLGEISAYMLGMIVSYKVREATMARAKIPEKDRKDFYLIIDEFQNFVSSGGMGFANDDDPIFAQTLSESRKFNVAMILANQYLGQLGDGMKSAVFGNVHSRIFFSVNASDAFYIKRQIPTGPKEEAYILNPNFYAYAQLFVNGQQIDPFTIKTITL